MADAMTQQSTKPVDDPDLDPNVKIKQQLTNATPTGTDQPMIPTPPPLPTTPGAPSLPGAGTIAGGATSAPSSPSDVTPSVPAPPTGEPAIKKVGDPSITFSGGEQQFSGAYDPTVDAGRGYEINPDQAGAFDQAKSTFQIDQLRQGGATNIQYNPFTRAYVDADKSPVYNATGTGAATPSASPAAPLASLSGAGGPAMTPSQSPSASLSPSAPMTPLSTVPNAPRAVIGAPSGGATDAGTPSIPIQAQTLSAASPVGTATGAPGAPYTDANVQIGSTVLPNADPRLSGTQSMLDTASKSLANVDRTKLAEDMFGQFSEATDPAYKLGLRRAAQSAAGAGRVGSGQLRTSYGDLANQRAQQLDLAKRGFMSNALEGSIQDQFNKVNALSGLEGQQFGEGASNRNELRGERGYQGSLEQQAFERALTQYNLQQQGQQQQFNNGLSLTNAGESNNPSDFYTRMAAQLGVDPSVIMQLAASLGKNSVGGSSTGGSSIPGIPQIPSFPGGTAPYIDGSAYPSGQYLG